MNDVTSRTAARRSPRLGARQGDDVVPTPGTKPVHDLEENVATADVELSPEDLARIEEAFPKGWPRDRDADTSTVSL